MKLFALFIAACAAIYLLFFTEKTVGVYTESGAPKTVFFSTGQCGKACNEMRTYLVRRKIEFEEHDAFDEGPGSALYKEYGGTGYMPLVAMGEQRVTGHSPGGVISALAIEFGPSHVKPNELRALKRHFDASGDPLVVMYATAWCGYCMKAREYFLENDIRFVEFDIEKDRAAKRDYNALLGSGTPLLYQGYKRVSGFDQRKIEAEFDL